MAANRSFDTIIIGAGSVGTPAAFFLAEAGVRTLVIDKFPSPGQGSNKSAIGGLRATHSDPAKIRLCLRSLEILSTWKERHGDDLEWYKGGYCYVAYRPEEEKILKDLLIVQHSFGLNIRWLDKEGIMEAIPGINPNGLIGGTLSPDDGNASPLRPSKRSINTRSVSALNSISVKRRPASSSRAAASAASGPTRANMVRKSLSTPLALGRLRSASSPASTSP